ncbi:MAG TPA: glycine cleavage system protein GcvH [Anaerolineaceae bacterium]|nr:glycine cleavage system protein GcvH [Anaerolineaceae bacterium]
MNIPADLKYTKTDEWVKVEGKVGTIGITDYAQNQLSDIVFVEIPVGVGEALKKGTTCGTIESVKAAADVNAPVSGTVTAVNEDLPNAPEQLNSDPFGKAWLLKVELSNLSELENMLDAAAYEAYCQERDH